MPTLQPAPALRSVKTVRRHSRIENLFLGTALAAFGLVAWGFQQDREWAAELLGWWPLLLAWIGLGKLLSGRFAGGIALLTGGGLAFLHLQGLADFEYTWPLILVAVGVAITLGALVGRGGPFAEESEKPSTTAVTAENDEETNRG